MHPTRITSQIQTLIMIVSLTFIAGCQGLNPFAQAETLEQKAFALEASYNIVLASAVDLIADPAVPASAKERILDVEQQATVVVESLAAATDEYIAAQALFEENRTTEERITIVANNLERWILNAESAIGRLSMIVKETGD
jgi:hypothetical protein